MVALGTKREAVWEGSSQNYLLHGVGPTPWLLTTWGHTWAFTSVSTHVTVCRGPLATTNHISTFQAPISLSGSLLKE